MLFSSSGKEEEFNSDKTYLLLAGVKSALPQDEGVLIVNITGVKRSVVSAVLM